MRRIFALVLLAGCTDSAPPAATPPAWTISAEPVVSIGVAEGDPAVELHRATGAVRLADGTIVVANSGTAELRLFDSAGAYVRAVGRRGSGPGEFRGTLTVYSQGGAVVVHDSGNDRYSVFDSTLTFRELLHPATGPGHPFPWDDWLRGNAWVSGVRDRSLRPCVAAALDRLPGEVAAPFQRVLVDEGARLWVRPLSGEGSGAWTIFDLEGRAIGEARLPDGFEPFQLGEGFILGRAMDSDGVERIRLHLVDGQRRSSAPACARTAEAMTEAAVTPDLGRDLLNLVVAQEAYFADHHGYAADADSLAWESGAGATLTIARHTPGGWAAIVRAGPGGPTCGIAVGDATPPGWREGAPNCAAAPGS